MHNQGINQRVFMNSPSKSPQNRLQWKKANQNLHNFIQNQNFLKNPKFNFSSQDYPKNAYIQKNVIPTSQCHLNDKRQRKQRFLTNRTDRDVNSIANILSRYRSVQRLQTISQKQKLICSIGIQVQEQDSINKKRCLIEENKCLKQLLNVLQTQIIDYSRKISQKQESIFYINGEYEDLKQKYDKKIEEVKIYGQKLKKQSQMNYYLEYIISQLNQKVSCLINENLELNQKFNRINKVNTKHNPYSQTFLQNNQNSQLSINSATFRKQEYNNTQKNTDSIIQDLDSKILPPDDNQNWSFSALQMSSFNKTPNKVHQISLNQQLNSRSPKQQTIQTKYEQNIQQILYKHKKQLNNLKQKIKYYQIQNSMLKRKKQLYQKNSQEIQQLKNQVFKLTQQNKIIKLLHNKKKKQTNQENKSKPQLNNEIKLINKPLKQSKSQKNQAKKINQNSQVSEQTNQQVNGSNYKKQNQKIDQTNHSNSNDVLRQSYINQIKQKEATSPKRKNFLQRKFVRKQNSIVKSPLKYDQDSEVSFSLSPQRIEKQKHKK